MKNALHPWHPAVIGYIERYIDGEPVARGPIVVLNGCTHYVCGYDAAVARALKLTQPVQEAA